MIIPDMVKCVLGFFILLIILIKISEFYWSNKKLKIIQHKNINEGDRSHIVQVSERGCMNKVEVNRIESCVDSIYQ